MNINSAEIEQPSPDYHVNIRVITFAVVSIVLILISIYFIRIYASKKQSVIYNMRIEADALQAAFDNDINYSKYFINLIGRQIKSDPANIKQIEKILQDYALSSNFNTMFGWRKYSWIDSNFKEIVTSTNGIEPNPRELYFIKQKILESTLIDQDFLFYISKTSIKNNSLKLISNVIDNGQYLGSIALSYDIATMIRRLTATKRNEYTNFVILDEQFNIVGQSKPGIDDIIVNTNNTEEFTPYFAEVLKKLNFRYNNTKEFFYLNMLSGINYYIKNINDLPFILIVNVDSDEIKNHILDGIIKKFVEVSIFAAIFLIVVISIYKRETWLRSKAELATSIANKATQAKTDFLAFTAHEIRSPLAFILTSSESMKKELFGSMPDNYKKYISGIYQNSRLILDFITDILDENQIIEGKFRIVNSITNIEEIIEKAIGVNKIRFNERKIDINVTYEPNLPQLICDYRRIFQVMSNLISNAIKYSNEKVDITITAKTVDSNMEIEVKDHGIGMNNEEIKIALSAYGVVRKKNQSFIESYGLGLPIVKMLLDAHESNLIIKSQPNVGTTVKIIFPKFKLLYAKMNG